MFWKDNWCLFALSPRMNNNLFENHGFVRCLMLHAADAADWGMLNLILCVSRAANVLLHGKDGPRIDKSVGMQKMLREALGSRQIRLDKYHEIAYYQRGVLHRENGPARIQLTYNNQLGNSGWVMYCEWFLYGERIRAYDFWRGEMADILEWAPIPPSFVRLAPRQWQTYKCPTQWFDLYKAIAVHQYELETVVKFSASRAEIERELDEESSSSSNVEEEESSEVPVLAPTFFDSAYATLDAVAKLRKAKRALAKLAPAAPKKKRLIKRSVNNDDD